MMEKSPRWQQALQAWEKQSGLGVITEALRSALRPLTPLGTQLLWFLQPAFGLFGQYEQIGDLAEALNDPAVDDEGQ